RRDWSWLCSTTKCSLPPMVKKLALGMQKRRTADMLQNSAGASRFGSAVILTFLFFANSSCSDGFNLLTEMSNSTSDAALLEGVKRDMAGGDYDAAVTKCQLLSAVYQTKADAMY